MLKYFLSVQTYLTGLLHRDDRGATAVEYGLLVALIAAIIVPTVVILGGQINAAFGAVVAAIAAA
jgi:pilus assembly protein Flp/PilA